MILDNLRSAGVQQAHKADRISFTSGFPPVTKTGTRGACSSRGPRSPARMIGPYSSATRAGLSGIASWRRPIGRVISTRSPLTHFRRMET